MTDWSIWITLDQSTSIDKRTPEVKYLENIQDVSTELIKPKITSKDWYIPSSILSSPNSIELLEINLEIFITAAWNSQLTYGKIRFSDKVIQIDNRSEHVLYVTHIDTNYQAKSCILDLISDYAKTTKSYSYYAGNSEVFDLLEMSKNSNLTYKWVI